MLNLTKEISTLAGKFLEEKGGVNENDTETLKTMNEKLEILNLLEKAHGCAHDALQSPTYLKSQEYLALKNRDCVLSKILTSASFNDVSPTKTFSNSVMSDKEEHGGFLIDYQGETLFYDENKAQCFDVIDYAINKKSKDFQNVVNKLCIQHDIPVKWNKQELQKIELKKFNPKKLFSDAGFSKEHISARITLAGTTFNFNNEKTSFSLTDKEILSASAFRLKWNTLFPDSKEKTFSKDIVEKIYEHLLMSTKDKRVSDNNDQNLIKEIEEIAKEGTLVNADDKEAYKKFHGRLDKISLRIKEDEVETTILRFLPLLKKLRSELIWKDCTSAKLISFLNANGYSNEKVLMHGLQIRAWTKKVPTAEDIPEIATMPDDMSMTEDEPDDFEPAPEVKPSESSVTDVTNEPSSIGAPEKKQKEDFYTPEDTEGKEND